MNDSKAVVSGDVDRFVDQREIRAKGFIMLTLQLYFSDKAKNK